MGCELADAQVSGQQIFPHASSHWRLCVVLAGGIQNELERDEKRARAGSAAPQVAMGGRGLYVCKTKLKIKLLRIDLPKSQL